MAAELFPLGVLVVVWVAVVIVFLARQRPLAVKLGKKKVYRSSRRYQRYFKPAERKMNDQACRLLDEINDALDHNRRIQPDRKASLKEQANQTADHVLRSLGKVARIRKHKTVVSSQRQVEITKMEIRLLVEVTRSLDVLEDALVSLTILDAAKGDANLDRLLGNLKESNARLRDIADAHEEIRTAGRLQIGEL